MLYTLLIPSPRCPSGVYVVCAGLSLFRVYVSVLVYACVIANYDVRWVEAKKHDGCVCECVFVCVCVCGMGGVMKFRLLN